MGFRTYDQDQWRRRIPYLKVGGAWVPVKKAQLKEGGTWRDFYNQQIIQPVIFLGELNNAQFTTYENVSILAGVSEGVLHNEGTGWLKFDYEGTELIVSKKTIRHSISWDRINSKGCVFGTKVITINGNQYKVRLLKGADHNPTQLEDPGLGYFLEGTHNSEWSKLFYPLVKDDTTLPQEIRNPNAPYTNLDLEMSIERDLRSWCQETHPGITSGRVVRGGAGVTFLSNANAYKSNPSYCWRPCLERVV